MEIYNQHIRESDLGVSFETDVPEDDDPHSTQDQDCGNDAHNEARHREQERLQ